MSPLKALRISKGLTQRQVSQMLGLSLRSYIVYENDQTKADSIKYKYIISTLQGLITLDEDHGILELDEIKEKCANVLSEYNVSYAILFGSYAKGTAGESSDVDILVSTEVTGLKFFGIAERLRNELNKRIDLLDVKQLLNNQELLEEILKYGVKIYDQPEG